MQTARTPLLGLALGALSFVAVGCGSDTTGSGTDLTGSLPDTVATMAPATSDAAGSDSTDLSVNSRMNQATDALQRGDFSTMLRLLELSGLAGDIEDNAVTILAPTEEAFSAMSSDELENLITNPTQIDDVLRRHILDRVYSYEELQAATSVTTMSGDTLTVTQDGGAVMIDGATVQEPQADAVSGDQGQEVAVFGIDKVLLGQS